MARIKRKKMKYKLFTKKNFIAIIIGLILGTTIVMVRPEYRVEEVTEYRSKLVFKNSSFEADKVLVPIVREFIDEAFDNSINVDSIGNTFMGIYIDYPPTGYAGYNYENMKYNSDLILISPTIRAYNHLREIIYHELGHKFLQRKHCHYKCKQIMSLADFGFYYHNWDKKKEVFWNNTQHEGEILPKLNIIKNKLKIN